MFSDFIVMIISLSMAMVGFLYLRGAQKASMSVFNELFTKTEEYLRSDASDSDKDNALSRLKHSRSTLFAILMLIVLPIGLLVVTLRQAVTNKKSKELSDADNELMRLWFKTQFFSNPLISASTILLSIVTIVLGYLVIITLMSIVFRDEIKMQRIGDINTPAAFVSSVAKGV